MTKFDECTDTGTQLEINEWRSAGKGSMVEAFWDHRINGLMIEDGLDEHGHVRFVNTQNGKRWSVYYEKLCLVSCAPLRINN